MKQLKPIFNSLLFKLFLSVVLIIGPLIIIHIVNNYYAVQVIRSQVAQSNNNMLNLYIDQIDNSLEGVGNYIFQLNANNTDLYYLQENESFDLNEYEEAKLRLFYAIGSQSEFYPTIDSIFIYSSTYDDFMNTQNYADSYTHRLEEKTEIIQVLRDKPDQVSEGKWSIVKGENNYYLLYYLTTDRVKVGAWVNMDKLIQPFKYIDFGENGRAFLTNSEFQPITSRNFIQEENINLTFTGNKYAITGKNDRFVAMKEKSKMGDFYLFALIPESEILEKLPFLQRISSLVYAVAIIFLLFFIFIMRKVFLQPINRIVTAMKKLRKGDLEVRLPVQPNSTEFEVMNDNFNHMISEIRGLKINVYEEKLNLQRAELKHLQLQINPHFFLNSLNIIYNLATVKEYEIIQEMSKCLANYFRYMFRSNSYFVSLHDELEHTRNYLRIQQLRFPDTFGYDIDLPKELGDCKIPPLVIQTMVENSIKHAFNFDKKIDISIAVKQESTNYITIKIQDTGEGFPEEVLEKLAIDESLSSVDGERIGIWNVKRRLALLYEDNTKIHFTNEEGKGATVIIQIPIESI
ncbi:sensor histidine kinase [Ferdinandcohnia quinoae]|uniref:histidine kinase n=1 Tax=Fredinandcohnia quinoae TaxID=2918902 RepID=A0AAW5E0Y0_9BACI|nr:histidine kinase [Fredinandcohnia sp. SECRCQ15]MCH1624364.1 histidine kinase [Fredinandcohnia sp. SECRCQ15]